MFNIHRALYTVQISELQVFAVFLWKTRTIAAASNNLASVSDFPTFCQNNDTFSAAFLKKKNIKNVTDLQGL